MLKFSQINYDLNFGFYRGVSRKRCCICIPVSAVPSRMLVFFALQLLFSGRRSLMTTGLRNNCARTFRPISCDVIFLKRSFLFLSILLDFPVFVPLLPWLVALASGPAVLSIFSSNFCRSVRFKFGICCMIVRATLGCVGRTIS